MKSTASPPRVRSVMTTSWLNQLGWDGVYVLEPKGADGLSSWPMENGPRVQMPAGLTPWRTIAPHQSAKRIEEGGPGQTLVLDLATSLKFRAYD